MKAVCGLDVHKDSIFLCILHSDGELFEQVFGVLTFQLEEMRKLLQKHHVFEVCMESTSIYWIPIWRVLSPHFTLTNKVNSIRAHFGSIWAQNCGHCKSRSRRGLSCHRAPDKCWLHQQATSAPCHRSAFSKRNP